MCKDEELLERFRSTGDPEAFRQIVESYKAYVFAIILRFVKNPADAQDIAQEVFLQIYQSLPQYQSGNFKGWLGTISSRKAIDWKRANSKISLDNSDEAIFSIRDESEQANPDFHLLQEEKKARIKELCCELPGIYSKVIQQYYFESMSYQDIASSEGVSLKTIESRLYRARNMMREKWREEGIK